MNFFYLQDLSIIVSIIHKFDIINIYENIISILYPGYSIIYRIFIDLSFFLKYIYNIWLRFFLMNNFGLFINRIIKLTIYYIWYMDKWLNRRIFKRRRRKHTYYRMPNIRVWKFLLFFYMCFFFITMWKKRNLYLKLHFITRPFYIYIMSLLFCAPIKYIIGIDFISTFLVINIIFFFLYINRK